MQRIQRRQLTTAIVTLLLTTPLWATNGYFTHGTGTKNKAMAGSGLAMPEDAIAIANNPAAAIEGAGKYDLGIAIFNPSRHYETGPSLTNGQCSPGGCAFTIGPNDIDSDNNYHYIPHMAGAWKINDESAWGAAFYGKGGMNTEWKGGTATSGYFSAPDQDPNTFPGTYGAGIFGGNGGPGVDFSQAFLEFSYARSAGDRFTYGASLVGVMQVFAARGVGTFGNWTESAALGQMPDSLSNNGHDQSYGLGVKSGMGWDLTDKVSFAVAYQPKIGMSSLKDYSDLFADGGNMDIPADLKLGFTFRPNPGLALNFDYEKIWYNSVVSVGNPFSNLFMCSQVNPMGSSDYCMGGKNGPGFGWENMDVFKIGAQWSSGNDWTWRAGFSHGDQPIPESEMVFNILAPGVIEDHATFGFTRKLASGDEFNMSFMYAFKEKVSGPNMLDYPDPAFAQSVSLDMSQWEIEFSYGWR
jgi:long-chain fatty acid transport protein